MLVRSLKPPIVPMSDDVLLRRAVRSLIVERMSEHTDTELTEFLSCDTAAAGNPRTLRAGCHAANRFQRTVIESNLQFADPTTSQSTEQIIFRCVNCITDIRGIRFTCKHDDCEEVHLCGECFCMHAEPGKHKKTHPYEIWVSCRS